MANLYKCTECGEQTRSTSIYFDNGTFRVCEECFFRDGWQYVGTVNGRSVYERGLAFTPRYER